VSEIPRDVLMRSLRALGTDPYTTERAAAAREEFARLLARMETDPALQARIDAIVEEVGAGFSDIEAPRRSR
jgi:hypothetical protein